jgi:predicted nucleotidyltransferase
MVTSLIVSNNDAIAGICRQHGIRRLSVFGSAQRDDFRPDSDIDLLVEFHSSAAVGLIEFTAIRNELSELLGRKVDLVTRASLRPQLRDAILAASTVLYAQ